MGSIVGVVPREVTRIHRLVAHGRMIEHRGLVGREGRMANALDFVVEFTTVCLFVLKHDDVGGRAGNMSYVIRIISCENPKARNGPNV